MPASNNIHVSKFKARAKNLLRAVRVGDKGALQLIQPYFQQADEFKLTQAQLVIARLHQCNSWKELVGKDDRVTCSFCGRWQYELKKLIAGPHVYVCNECVELCNDILQEEHR